ncbi:hypothetical protein, partial [Phocaeicola coprocola]|uniref:hypothetical protein n=1 Tax=Phocaeicola coprocola TaxID=310298 RepID=UPI003F7F232D
ADSMFNFNLSVKIYRSIAYIIIKFFSVNTFTKIFVRGFGLCLCMHNPLCEVRKKPETLKKIRNLSIIFFKKSDN